MTTIRTALARHRSARTYARDERALRRALAAAPTVEAAHEISAIAARR